MMAAPDRTPRRARWSHWADRLAPPQAELAAQERRTHADRWGGSPICDLHERDLALVCGSLRSVTVRPRAGQVPALAAELDDGTTLLRLVWLGRRRIGGIEPGARLRAWGRVSTYRGNLTIFNPAYALLPPGPPSEPDLRTDPRGLTDPRGRAV